MCILNSSFIINLEVTDVIVNSEYVLCEVFYVFSKIYFKIYLKSTFLAVPNDIDIVL